MNKDNLIPKYTTIVQLALAPDGLYYVAGHPELENCFSDGQTVEEALENLEEVTQMVLEHLREHHLPVPAPEPVLVNPRELNQHRVFPTRDKQAESVDLRFLPVSA